MSTAACTSTDLLDEDPKSGASIGFSTNVTRALTNDNFSKFLVYGGYTPKDVSDYHTVFSGVAVSKDADQWTYEGASKYWVKDAVYKFYAYSCENIALTKGTPEFATTGADAGTFKITDFVCNKDHQHDLIYAESGSITGKETGNTAVPFSFRHLLSRVKASFKSGFDPEFTIEISEVELHNVYDKADFSSKSGAWSNQSRTIEYNLASSEWTMVPLNIEGADNVIQAAKPAEGGSEAVAAKELTTQAGYVLPVAYSSNNVTLSFKITVKQGTDIIKSDYVKGNLQPTWAIATSYTYNITVNGSAAGVEKIEFSVDASNGIQDWTESPGTDFNVGS
ncbi:fimbrillin family protein [uncultured Alistipes sp.]|uniref:fimbrillin family protein n=1 Tax=uncultured Alistipes sp. TaxID=538949 RepID=UPI0026366114|nr:fimbrillin family protein [uncultured Alistipes sp.]